MPRRMAIRGRVMAWLSAKHRVLRQGLQGCRRWRQRVSALAPCAARNCGIAGGKCGRADQGDALAQPVGFGGGELNPINRPDSRDRAEAGDRPFSRPSARNVNKRAETFSGRS